MAQSIFMDSLRKGKHDILDLMKRITLDLEESLYERLRKAAFDRHESVAAATREALEGWLGEADEVE